MEKYLKYIVLSLCLVFISCEYEIDYSGKLGADKMVTAIVIEADSTICFSVQHSAVPGVYDGVTNEGLKKASISNSYVDDAEINLYVNGNLQETINHSNYDSHSYRLEYIPKKDDKIKITIDHEKYEQIVGYADLSIEDLNINDIHFSFASQDVSVDTIYDSEGNITSIQTTYYSNNSLNVSFTIIDNGGENYYQIIPYRVYRYNNSFSEIDMDSPKIIYESHPGVYYANCLGNISTSEDDKHNKFGVISNERFKGQAYSLILQYDSYVDKSDNGGLRINRIDRNIYEYLLTFGNYLNNWLIDLNPVYIANGLTGGYGYIGSRKSFIYTSEIDGNK